MPEVTDEKSAAVIVLGNEPGAVRRPFKLRNRKPRSQGRTKPRMMSPPHQPSTTTKPMGGVRHGYGSEAEKESSYEDPLFDQVLSSENLNVAWKQVRANKGAAGVDGVEVSAFPAFYRKHWDMIQRKLEDGTYRPSPVRRVFIPKPDGSQRALGIPTVLDRLIQQAIAQVLTPLYDPTFSDHSHGFRPRRSVHGAAEEWKQLSGKKGKWACAVDCDLKSFFDVVNHQKLMTQLGKGLTDRRLLGLIHGYLKAGAILSDGRYESTSSGVPQGGPLSPLLSNILLDELDKELEARGHDFVRYADDFVILCGSPRAGDRILASVKQFVEKRLKLIVNESKSRVVALKEASFLGFCLLRKKIRWTMKSKKHFKAEVKRITRRTRGVSPRKVIHDLRLYVRGAINHYVVGITFREACELDGWMRRRVRLYYWKQWGRPRTRRRKLLSLGIGQHEVKKASRSRKGHWRMSQNSLVRTAMTNDWLSDQGVPSIEEQWISVYYPNG